MATLVIEGGWRLEGEITPAGNKNAVLPIMAATILTDQSCLIENVPQITDVEVMAAIITDLGGQVNKLSGDRLKINCRQVSKHEVDPELAKRLRASVLLIGPLLARFGQVKLPQPGGDIIGKRAINTHLDAFQQLGVAVKQAEAGYTLKSPTKIGKRVFLDEASVTATENLIMFTANRPGQVTLDHAASEPHVANLARFLNQMGAQIKGAGTNRVIICGSKDLTGATGRIDPDQIEIGTWVIAAAVTKGRLKINNVQPDRLGMILTYLSRLGVGMTVEKDQLSVRPAELKVSSGGKFQTQVWPGFPSDLMSPFIVLATQAQGLTLCHDWMYNWRLYFVDQLIRMGADIIICDPHRLLVNGPTKLAGREMESPDIRAGMALILAALVAGGTSTIHRVEHVDRGYPRIEKRLKRLGAKIKRLEEK